MWSKYFWLSLAERAIKSFAQGLIVVWPIGENALGLWQIDWKTALLSAALYAGASVLTSIISAPLGPDGSPSLVGEPPKQPAAVLEDDAAPDPVPDPEDATPSGRHVLDDDPDDVPARNYMTRNEIARREERKI